MKRLITISLLIATTFIQYAQTAPSAGDFRIFKGKLYNIKKSAKWEKIGGGYSDLEVVTVGQKTLFLHENSMMAGGGFTVTKAFFLYNHPLHDKVITGQHLESVWCIRVENININGTSYAAYDYGFPNTPENRKKFLDVEK